MCAASRPKSFTAGWSIATRPQDQPRWRMCGRRPGIVIRLVSDSGAWEMSPGDAGVTLVLKSMPKSFVASPPGSQVMEGTCRSSDPVPTWTIGVGPAVFLRRLCEKGRGHWEVMGEIDREHHVKLVVDEWGPWYKPGSEATPGDIIEQMPTLRDAVFSGMTLDIFNRNPEKVAMANCAQLINCLNSLYLAHEDKFVVTPVGHVLAMYAAHQGGQGLRTLFSSPSVNDDRDGKPATFWGLRGSASLNQKNLCLTVVNPHVSEGRETEIVLRGATVRSGSVTTLTHSDIHAHNTFERRDVVTLHTSELKIAAPLVLTFPPASVTAVNVDLA